jgi:heme/copper-type cytochrome/quinol oxidase subunit 2
MGRMLILAGLALVVLGVLVIALNRFNIPLGRLPGDVVWRGKNSTVYFPWVTCLLISIVLTILFWLFNRRP